MTRHRKNPVFFLYNNSKQKQAHNIDWERNDAIYLLSDKTS